MAANVRLRGGCILRLALLFEMFCIPLFEFLNTAGGIDKFLLASEKGMAGRTDFHPDLRHHGAEFHFITAGA